MLLTSLNGPETFSTFYTSLNQWIYTEFIYSNPLLFKEMELALIYETEWFMRQFWELPNGLDCVSWLKEIHTAVADAANTNKPSGVNVWLE